MNRREKILHKLDLTGEGLEIGPLCWPVLQKDEGKVQYVDHLTRGALLKVYADDKSVPPDQIVDIDYALNGRTLHQTVPQSKQFNYIIASHVMEHVPDLVRWFNDLSSVLKVGGVISLAVPDKRFTFDIDRHPSSPADVVGAYIDNLAKPASATILDYATNYRMHVDAGQVWAGNLYLGSTAPHRYSYTQALDLCDANKKHYVDTHCYVFTPHSFIEILRVLIELDLLRLKVVSFFDTPENLYEFYISLQKMPKATSKRDLLESLPTLSRSPYPRELEANIKNLENEITNLRNTTLAQHRELQFVLQSKSWRLTRPIRYGVRQARRIKRKLRQHTLG